ncbi:MAG: thioredoxin-like domain-containing protein [Bacteroidota bacterium]
MNIFAYSSFCLLAIISLLSIPTLQAQDSGYRIEVQVDSFPHQQLYLAHFYGGQPRFLDTVKRNDQQQFVFEGADLFYPGIYLIVLPPRNQAIQIVLDEADQTFQVKANAKAIVADQIHFEGSEANTHFYRYLVELREKRKELADMRAYSKLLAGKEKAKHEKKMRKQITKIRDYQERMVNKSPGTPAALMSGIDREPLFPDFEGSEKEIQQQRFAYQRQHFFDELDIQNSQLSYTPLFYSKVNFYVSKMTVQEPDSVCQAIDQVLELFSVDTTNYRALITYFTKRYKQPRVVGMDEVYVYIYDQYYKTGKVHWLNDELMKSVEVQAEKFRPVLIGKTAPDIEVQRKDGSSIRLHEIDSDYTVLYFWRPGCGHCKKATPNVKAFYQVYQDLGVEILSVCTQHGEGVQSCWDYVAENELEEWIQAVDPYHRSRFIQKFNAQRTPKIYVLDRDKKILLKDFKAENLPEVMDRLMREHPPKKESE